MTMLQPTRVLPSNAPPLQDGSDGLHQASRVLQEHSGNRQQHLPHDAFGSAPSDWNQLKQLYDPQKYPANVLTGENAYPTHHSILHRGPHQVTPSAHRSHNLYPNQASYRPSFRNGHGRFWSPQDEAKLQHDAERLYQRFAKSDQYVKYRTRQSKEDKGNSDQKWPDHLEKAFFRGESRSAGLHEAAS